MSFKVGDKVKVIANEKRLKDIGIPKELELHGRIGIIKIIKDEGVVPYGVDMGEVKEGRWWFAGQDFKLVESAKGPEPLRVKDTNPKDALGIKKVPMHAVPCGPEFELGLVMMSGGRKYGTHNYRAAGVRASVYYDAIMRHVKAWWEGEDLDPDSGIHHLMHAVACGFVARDSMMMGNFEDDRPIKYPNGLGITELNKRAENIISKYPDCVQPYLEINKVDRTKPVEGGY